MKCFLIFINVNLPIFQKKEFRLDSSRLRKTFSAQKMYLLYDISQ